MRCNTLIAYWLKKNVFSDRRIVGLLSLTARSFASA